MQNPERERYYAEIDQRMGNMVRNVASRYKLPDAVLVLTRFQEEVWIQGMRVAYLDERTIMTQSLGFRLNAGEHLEMLSFVDMFSNFSLVCDQEFVHALRGDVITFLDDLGSGHYRLKRLQKEALDVYVPSARSASWSDVELPGP
ncbi:MAG: hypothetical protein HYV39_01705 [Candidatus Levybacteria bacterium]|nr:hypothetical protein [Candidatus Levybacteria bacterium]